MKSIMKKIAISIIIVALTIGLFIMSLFSNNVERYQTGLKTLKRLAQTENKTAMGDVGINAVANSGVPTVVLKNYGTEIKVGGYAEVEVSDPDGVTKIFYDWYKHTTGTEEILVYRYENPQTIQKQKIPVPSEPGLYILRVNAMDAAGNSCNYEKAPYKVVREYSTSADTTPPEIKWEEGGVPDNYTYVEPGKTFEIIVEDKETEIYFIGTNWSPLGTPLESVKFNMNYLPKNNRTTVTVPNEVGDYTFRVYAKNGLINPITGDFGNTGVTYYNYYVRNKLSLDQVTLNQKEFNQEFTGTPRTVTATAPEGAGKVTVNYYDANGENVERPINVGTYTVKVAVAAGDSYAPLEETELAQKLVITPNTQSNVTISLDKNQMTIGDTAPVINVTGTPAGARTVTSSNTSVARIVNGNIEIVGAGTTTITVKYAGNANYAEKVATLELVVNRKTLKVSDLTVEKADLNQVYDGVEKTVRVTTLPGAGTPVVKYYQNGVEVSPKAAGTYTVKVSVPEGTEYSALPETEIGTLKIKAVYTISFVVKGETKSTTIEEGNTITKPADPENYSDDANDYTFAGWYTNAEGTGTAYDFENTIPTGNVTLYAKFNPIAKVYNVDVKATTNGQVTADKTSGNYDNNITLTVTPNAGYELETLTVAGQDVTANVTNGTYTFQLKGNTEVTATFKTIEYTVKFDTNNGNTTTIDKTTTVLNNYKVEFPSNPSKTGYNFIGWFVGETQVTADTLFNTALETTVVAKYEVITTTVTFDADNGTANTTATTTIEAENKVTKPEDPSKTGYTFEGWFKTDAEGNITGEAIDFTTETFTSDTTLKAKYEVVTYTVKFDTNNGNTTTIDKTTTVEDEYKVEFPENPSKTGYDFIGWFVGDTEVTENTSFTFDETLETTVVAKYEAIEYTIKFMNGKMTYRTQTKIYGDLIEAPTITKMPDKQNEYTFAGWYDNEELNGEPVNFENITVEDNATYYAKFDKSPRKYTVQFIVAEYGILHDEVKVEYGNKINAPATAPSIEGAEFVGWVEDLADTELFDFENSKVERDITLYARFGIEYNINIDTVTNGTVSVSPEKAMAGKTITVTATPDTNYILKAITVTDAEGNEVEVTGNTFVMPASEVTVSAEFAKRELTEIVANYNDDTAVAVGTTLDQIKANVTVTAKYNDGSEENVTEFTLSGNLTSGTANTITVTALGETDEITVTVEARELVEIVANYNDDTAVAVGTTLDQIKANVTVTAKYNDGSEENVTEFTLSGNLTSGTANTITVTALGETDEITVTVEARELVEIVANYNDDTAVAVGTTLDQIKANVTVTAKYNDGSEENVTEFTLEGTLVAGQDNTITVKALNKETTITVTVEKKTGIPVIEVTSDEVITLEVNRDTYTAPTVRIKDFEGNLIAGAIAVVGGDTVDTSKVATYVVTYNYTDSEGNAAEQVSRTIKVVDTTAPVFESIDRTVKVVEAGSELPVADYVVTDNYDSSEDIKVEITGFDSRKTGIQTIRYTATDTNGNSNYEEIKINVVDTTAPTITLVDESLLTQTFTKGEGRYQVPTFRVTDNSFEGTIDISEEMPDENNRIILVRDGVIRPEIPGTYTVKYTVYDASLKSSEIVITVKVLEYPPDIGYFDGDEPILIKDGDEFATSIIPVFGGTGELTNLKTGVVSTIISGVTSLSDGNYKLTATLPDGATTTVRFTINTQPPKVNVLSKNAETGVFDQEEGTLKQNGWYKKEVKIVIPNVENISEARLVCKDIKLVVNDINQINGMILNEGANDWYTYSLYLKDTKGREITYTFDVDT